MNERIKEMAKLAQLRAEWMTPQGLEWFDNFKEQFTELIVKECIGVVEGGRFLHDHAPTALFAKECSSAIKKHFGIAEREE